jgi:hypothetical protein
VHVAPVSFLNNTMNKGRWTENKHKIFMQKWEKYGNNLMQIAKVLSTRSPAQIKKHAEMILQTKLKNKFCSSLAISHIFLFQ